MNILDKVVKVLKKSVFCSLLPKEGKFTSFVEGQNNVFNLIGNSLRPQNTLWVHASSLGELAVVRPIIKEIRKNGNPHIVLTFFSPTGFNATTGVNGPKYTEVDEIYYLPIDTVDNAKLFLNCISPMKAIYAVSELWPNYLFELKRRNIPTFLVSAKISNKSSVLKWYGRLFRNVMSCFNEIFCLDANSKSLLDSIGICNVKVTGDALFDNAIAISRQEYRNDIIERFCSKRDVFIAGSIHDSKDLEMVSFVANNNPDDRFVFVPHEICEENLNSIRRAVNGKCLFYSEYEQPADLDDIQVLVIDYLGDLSKMYRYCKFAYIGGGFTPYLHSVIEATVYGLPVAFGPRIERKATPIQLIELGIGTIVENSRELNSWYVYLKSNTSELQSLRETAIGYANDNSGATSSIVKMIMEG
ncbi:MAG: 3-deoxy-D-manno-octulosonic acid transferase [Prevotella sp.]